MNKNETSRNVVITALLLLALFVFQCTPPVNMKVLVRMLDAQEQFFRSEVIPGVSSEYAVQCSVIHYSSVDSIIEEIEHHQPGVGLVKVPFDKGWSLVQQNALVPINTFLDTAQMLSFTDTYLLTSLGKKDGNQYFIPRKFETRIMVYRKSKVQDACALWRKHREDINTELIKYNGFGLPSTYLLEDDPMRWDFFDVFVAGWVWAHVTDAGRINPRVAHRGKMYSGTALRVIDRVYSCGGDEKDVLSMSGESVVDAFFWEAIYAASGIYNPRMWTESWSGSGVWKGFSEDDVFLSFMTQLDCFFIHGTNRDGLTGYLSDPDDMGVALMPQGVSVELDDQGEVLRPGRNTITTGGWWWAIPSSTPDALASYHVARHITNTQNQISGCSRFGMIPVRKDILSDMALLFGGGWITRIYDVSFRQLMANKGTTLPDHPYFDKIRDIYLAAWYDIVVQKNWSEDTTIPDRSFIKERLENNYQQHILSLL